MDTLQQTPQTPSSWQASLALRLGRNLRGTVLSHSRHQGPLYVQKPFYPEGRQRAHIYLLHPPGGLVSGDHLQIDIDVDPQAHGLITTPGAGRVYRARSDGALQQQTIALTITDQASLEWLPLETILYPGANTKLNTHISLHGDARFIGWDITCLGLPASGQAFEQGQLRQSLQIHRNGRLALRETLRLDAHSLELLHSQAGLQNHSVNALMVAGPFADSDAELINTLRSNNEAYGDGLTGISQVGEFLVLRHLGPCAEQARRIFTQAWTQIRPALLQTPACPPRIWAT